MTAEAKKPSAGDTVTLAGLPPRFLDGLLDEDQAAIASKVGKAVLLIAYDEHGRAELELDNEHRDGGPHTRSIFVDPSFIGPER